MKAFEKLRSICGQNYSTETKAKFRVSFLPKQKLIYRIFKKNERLYVSLKIVIATFSWNAIYGALHLHTNKRHEDSLAW